MATKKQLDDCGGLKPIVIPRMKGDKDPTKPMGTQKKTVKKTVKRTTKKK